MMTSSRFAVVPAASGTIGRPEFEVLYLDPDVAALIAEVDAILCAALIAARRPPATPVAGSDITSPGRLDGPAARRSAPRPAPVHPVRAVQRGPPTREQPVTKVNDPM